VDLQGTVLALLGRRGGCEADVEFPGHPELGHAQVDNYREQETCSYG
jgi:hypothetical protein